MHLSEADAWKLVYYCTRRANLPARTDHEYRAKYNGLDLKAVNQKLR